MQKRESILSLKKEALFGKINNYQMNISIKTILENANIIAIMGASNNKDKDSYKVMKYLQKNGYKILPINPKVDEKTILGERVYKNLEDIEVNIDILNIFRPSSEVLEITKKIISKKVQTVWLQLDIICSDSQKLLEKTNINFVQNRCTKIEHANLLNKN